MPKVLPPGLSAATFATAIKALTGALGPGSVFTDEDDLDLYRDPYSLAWGEPDERLASAVVLPKSVEEVQAVVKIARQYKLPLHPVSTGKNLTYGGAAPNLSGAVIVDLKKMNRILAVDDKRNFCLVEPGVTYFDLYRYIQEKGLKVWLDVPDTGWGSLVGNALDRGVGYTASAFRDHFGSHCGLEAVLPTGEVMRTGMGALPGADSWQDFKYGVGPYVDGLFAQGGFGIVTKMGFWLMPQPEAWLTGIIDVSRYSDISALIEQVNYLEDAGIMNGKPFYNSPPFHPFEGNFPSAAPPSDLGQLMANGWPSMDKIMAHARAHGGPSWWCTIQFYGPEKVIRANWAYTQKRLREKIPGATFRGEAFIKLPLTKEQEAVAHLVDFGIPNMAVFHRSPAEIDADELHAPLQYFSDFLAVIPRNGEAVLKAQRVLYDTQKAMGAPLASHPFQAPIAWSHRSFVMAAPTIASYQGDPAANAKGRALYQAYMKNMAAAGFAPYRTNVLMQDLLAAQYSFNDNALLRFQERLKDGADPDGIIAPGRYGVWPARMRKAGGKPA